MALNSSMAEVLRLTRSGHLMEATAAIRKMLGTSESAAPAPAHETESGIIDLVSEQGVWRASTSPLTAFSGAEPKVGRTNRVQKSGSFEEQMYRGAEGSIGYIGRPMRPPTCRWW